MRISFDFDGVLSVTPFGRLSVHAPGPVDDLPPDYEKLYDHAVPSSPLRLAVEYLRFGWRTSASDAHDVLHRLTEANEVYIVTARTEIGAPLVRSWLRKQGLADRIAGIRMAPPGLRPAQHKLASARMLGIDVHIDDDPRTAYHLAANGVRRVFLLDHAGAPGDATPPPALTRVHSLTEFADALG